MFSPPLSQYSNQSFSVQAARCIQACVAVAGMAAVASIAASQRWWWRWWSRRLWWRRAWLGGYVMVLQQHGQSGVIRRRLHAGWQP
jgi:hypothetical protein